MQKRLLQFWAGLRQGERVLFFTVGVLLVFGFVFWLLAITHVTDVLRVREYYDESPKADAGFQHFKRLGCRNCHVVFKIGEWGLGPELDGSGTRHTFMWLRAYLEDPKRAMQGKTMHDGSYAMDFTDLTEQERDEIATFLFAQKANPGSATYMTPPE